MEEYSKLSPAMAYNARYGFKQSNTDSYADAQTRAEFEAELDKKVAANYVGTINERGTVTVVEKKTDLELEVIKLAGEKVDATTPAGKKRTIAERAALIDLYVSLRRADLTAEAETRLAKNTEIQTNPEMLAELEAMGLVPKAEAPKATKKAA
jgi:hypothetical protein